MSKRLKYPYFFQQRELSLNIGKLNLQADFRSCFLARILFLGGGRGGRVRNLAELRLYYLSLRCLVFTAVEEKRKN